jgi:hypothetical protein
MTYEDKELLLVDLCARLVHGVVVVLDEKFGFNKGTRPLVKELLDLYCVEGMKPYLRPMFSMTEKEAKEIATLHGLKNILSVKITDEYIDVIIDDGFSSTEKITLWYDEIISSIEIFDYLNANHFDYRGLIEEGLALEAPEGMYKTE